VPFETLEFDTFHTEELPARLASDDGLRAAADLAGVKPIAFRLDDGRSYTYAPSSDGIVVTPGDDGAHTVVELSQEDWSDFVWELRTCFALFYAERVRFPRGSLGLWARWEPALRALYDGQAIYDLTAPAPVDCDLHQSFTLDDSDDDIRAYLDQTGFIHVRGVFDPDEVAAMQAVVETAVARARPDDQQSWWTTVDGAEVCNRVNYLNEQSELIAGLGDDPRLRRIGDLARADLRDARDRMDGNGVVIKVPGAETGLADLPWHRDCGMGGHPVKCPLLNVGIQLDPATAAAGQLHMIAGSHLGTSPLPTAEQAARLPTVAIDTQPGDVTAHYGHTLHAAPPPGDRAAAGRRALYVTYVPELVFEMIPPGQGYNDVLFTRDGGRIHHVDELRA
jgi:hypothetical protein